MGGVLKPDVRELLMDEDIGGGEEFVIIRRVKERVKGRTVEPQGASPRITAYGTLQPAGLDALQQLPEADRSGEVLVVRTTTRLQMGKTGDDYEMLSDEIEYNGGRYKILQLADWNRWGMYRAYVTKVGDA